VPTGREEEWGPKFIPFQTIVRGNNNADTWFEMAALTIDLETTASPTLVPRIGWHGIKVHSGFRLMSTPTC
jgi:hypothetical protein